MMRFFESLTDEEKLVLSRLSLAYLDDKLPEGWDEEKERVEFEKTVEGKQVTIQGFKDNFFELKTYRVQGMEFDLPVDDLMYISRLSNHQERKKLDLSEYRQKSYGAVLANQSSGGTHLFDHPVDTQNFISIEFNDARVYGDLDGSLNAGDEVRISGDVNTLNIRLAPEQYVRFVRSQNVKVPCTIARRAGYLNDEPESDYLTTVREANEVREQATEAVSPLIEIVKELADLLESGKMTSQKRFDTALALLEQAEAAYKECFEKVNEVQTGSVTRVQENFRQRMIDQVEHEVKSLPSAQKEQVMLLLQDIGKDL